MKKDTLVKVAREINTKLELVPPIKTKGASYDDLEDQIKEFKSWCCLLGILHPETVNLIRKL